MNSAPRQARPWFLAALVAALLGALILVFQSALSSVFGSQGILSPMVVGFGALGLAVGLCIQGTIVRQEGKPKKPEPEDELLDRS